MGLTTTKLNISQKETFPIAFRKTEAFSILIITPHEKETITCTIVVCTNIFTEFLTIKITERIEIIVYYYFVVFRVILITTFKLLRYLYI